MGKEKITKKFYGNDWKNNNPNPAIDMTGRKINMLTVLYRAQSKNGRTMWHCKCDCGNEVDVCYSHLKKGQYSCGCATKERIRKSKTVHGGTNTRLFRTWTLMKQRCYKPYHKSYSDYGGRGISVCKEWFDDFGKFREWALKNGYNESAKFGQCTLDRIDVNGNYEPNNCRFVGMKTQCNNRRNNVVLSYKDETHTIAQWSELLGIPYDTLYKRFEYGWTVGQILGFEFHKGVRVKPKFISYDEYRLAGEPT